MQILSTVSDGKLTAGRCSPPHAGVAAFVTEVPRFVRTKVLNTFHLLFACAEDASRTLGGSRSPPQAGVATFKPSHQPTACQHFRMDGRQLESFVPAGGGAAKTSTR
eukprot:10014862-Alexandrium_andersonii.AAC.1